MDWIQAVSTVGFPIVSFFAAGWALKYSFDKSNEANDKWRDELSKLTSAVNETSKTLAMLVEKLDDIDKKGECKHGND